MTAVNSAQLQTKVPFFGEQGNMSVWHTKETYAANNGDVIYLGKIPAGAIVTDMDLVFDACGASVTAKLGYAPVNASDGPSSVDNYWLASGQDISSAGRLVSKAQEISFLYDVYVILTLAGANLTTGTPPNIGFVAKGEIIGLK